GVMQVDNNISETTWLWTCGDYTSSLPKIERERPRSANGVELIAEDDLLGLFLRHAFGFGYDLHDLNSIRICTAENNARAARVERLLDLWHVDRAVILRARRRGNGIH